MERQGAAPANSAGIEIRERPRFSKGGRPTFRSDPDSDRLLAIVTALAGEVWVLRERLDTAERLAESGLPATQANIEAYRPDPDVEADRDRLREQMLTRVFRALSAPPGAAEDEAYNALIKQCS